MPTLLEADQVADNPWTLVLDTETTPDDLPAGPVMIPVSVWLAHRSTLSERQEPVAIWLPSDAEPDEFADELDSFELIGIQFPSFNDGRALSLATLLRTRYGYRGALRAVGEVHEDLIHYMRRCGIDSYLLREGGNVEAAQRNYAIMSDYYQGSVIEPQPLFRRARRSAG